ncbi:xylitol oxidase [Frondihabitans sp. PhB188]|uniref:D-arabinono-1,4-lactone oxidase n=1 Tax=Frondihabitans sp. PhB188 TaxID=2485200 RepID=UPI000F46F88E|nr:D-arabinono-1,4-lactone oxidase [Frondihabitans sp. PhB188]ROQ39867.1 xylitol oxidase [Frondihabitans sp. PhB188]
MTFTAEREQNWAGTHVYGASRILNPTSVDELRTIVAAEPRVRALGTRHSFNSVADGPGVLVSPIDIPADIVVSDDRTSVAVGAGTRYAVVATELERQGLALHNMGSLPHISVGGATATGTHGSGAANGSLATSVRALEFVTADGSVRTVTRGDADFAGSVIHLGALGIVSRVTLDVEPSYRVRQDVYLGVPWSSLEGAGLREIMSCAYSVSLFTVYGDDITQMWVKTRIPEGVDDVEMPDELFGGKHNDNRVAFVSEDDNTTPMDGSVGPWVDRLPHFRIDRNPSNGEEIQTEYFVSLDEGAAAIQAVRTLAAKIQPHLLVTELRAVAGDDFWLSETQGQDSLCIHFTWAKHVDEVAELIPQIEEVLRPFTPRPHWGKVNTVSASELEERYPRLGEFRALVAKHDPDGKFSGGFLDELVLGR